MIDIPLPAAPRFHCSLLTTPEDLPTAARLSRIARAGFHGVQTVPSAAPDERSRFGELLGELGLSASGCGHIAQDRPAEPLFELAAAAGMSSLNAQVDGYWRDDDWQDARVAELLDLSRQYRLPFFLETHRHRMTQDPRRTLALTERHPELVLCGDFSHYIVAAELRAPWPEEWRTALHTLAARCGEIHLRLNNGHRVQDPLPSVEPAQRAEFTELWRSAHRARPDDLLVTTELLPASIGYDPVDLSGRPIGDIWEDSTRLLAETTEQLARPERAEAPQAVAVR